MATRRGPDPLIVGILIGVAFIGAGIFGISSVRRGLVITDEVVDGMPVRTMVAEGRPARSAPGVLVAHGFAASRQIMYGYAYALAHSGYVVTLWDFAGHGANRNRLAGGGDRLQADVDAALGLLLARPEVDPERIAVVGHSMGSGAAMTAGIRRPDVFSAVVALSPTGAAVTPELPRNLLLQAGSWERRFVANATRLLAEAGGEREGTNARRLLVVPNVEHITILFSGHSREATLAWLDEVFGAPGSAWRLPGGRRDTRLLGYLFAIAGMILVALTAAPELRELARLRTKALTGGDPVAPATVDPLRPRPVLRALAGPVVATAVVWLLALVTRPGGGIGNLGGIAVGGALALWFGIYGGVWLALGIRPSRPTVLSLSLGVTLFVVLSVFVGRLGQEVVYQWALTPYRLARFPVAALLVLPWQLAAGHAQADGGFARRAGMYALQAVPVVVCLALLGLFVPGFFFVVLLLPAIPIVMAIMALLGSAIDHPWSYGVGNALFFGWLLAAVFPLA